MTKSSQPMAGPRAIIEGDARRIVVVCRQCLDEEAESLAPSTRMRMLAIQRAMEETGDLPGGFSLKAVNDQIRQIAGGVENVPGAVVTVARRADLRVTREHRRSFYTSYISGKTHDTKKRRFNSYVRVACKRLGLKYIAVIGGSPDGQYTYYYLKQGAARSRSARYTDRCRTADGDDRGERRTARQARLGRAGRSARLTAPRGAR